MTTPAVTPQAPPAIPPNIFDKLAQGNSPDATTPGPAPAPTTGGNIFDQLADGTYKEPDTTPGVTPDTQDEQSRTRQMLVGGMTGQAQPVMNDVEKQQFERGKAAGAISVPVVAGATTGLSFTPEIVSAVADMAKAHPVAAKFIKRVIVAGGGAEALKHKDWLMKVLP